jgi:hypothetical protein
LDSLAIAHSVYAPYVYKTLIFTLIENRGNYFIGEFIINNMCLTLTKLPHIPVGVLIEPLVKQATLQRQHNTDFDFYTILAKHPRLRLRHALLLMDFLGKFCLHDPFLARIASIPFFIIFERFNYSEPVQVCHAIQFFSKRESSSAPACVQCLCIDFYPSFSPLPFSSC